MREIKFRGKDKDNSGGWVYGCYFYNIDPSLVEDTINHAYIKEPLRCIGSIWRVKPETVGQLIGVKDKNGVEIFEGDIMECYRSGQSIRGRVVIEDGCSFIKFNNNSKAWVHEAVKKFKAIVIGNIVDNPELLGKEE